MGNDSGILLDVSCGAGLVVRQGLKGKSHFCLKAAIKALYVDEGAMDQRLVDDYDATMMLRETADYRADFSEGGALASIDCAGRFLNESKRILLHDQGEGFS